MKKIIFIIMLALNFIGCSGDEQSIGGSGLIEATEVLVSAQTSGQIEQLMFDEGMLLNIGDTLIVVDTSKIILEKQSAESKLEVAKTKLESYYVTKKLAKESLDYLQKELDRQKKMIGDGASSKQNFDKVKHEFDMATINLSNAEVAIKVANAEIKSIEADIAKIQRMLKDCFIVAPLKGVVSKKYVDNGELVSPGKTIAKIIDNSDLWVKIYLPAVDFSEIKIGDVVKVDTEFDKVFKGTIIWTSDEAEFTPKNIQTKKSRTNLVYAVKAKISDNDGTLKVGMPVYVTMDEK